MDHQHSNTLFAFVLVLAVNSIGNRRSGPPGEVTEPIEGLKGPLPAVVVVRDLGGNSVVFVGGGKGVATILLVEPVLTRRLRDHTGGTPDGVRGDKSLAIGRTFVQ